MNTASSSSAPFAVNTVSISSSRFFTIILFKKMLVDLNLMTSYLGERKMVLLLLTK